MGEQLSSIREKVKAGLTSNPDPMSLKNAIDAIIQDRLDNTFNRGHEHGHVEGFRKGELSAKEKEFERGFQRGSNAAFFVSGVILAVVFVIFHVFG